MSRSCSGVRPGHSLPPSALPPLQKRIDVHPRHRVVRETTRSPQPPDARLGISLQMQKWVHRARLRSPRGRVLRELRCAHVLQRCQVQIERPLRLQDAESEYWGCRHEIRGRQVPVRIDQFLRGFVGGESRAQLSVLHQPRRVCEVGRRGGTAPWMLLQRRVVRRPLRNTRGSFRNAIIKNHPGGWAHQCYDNIVQFDDCCHCRRDFGHYFRLGQK